MGHFALFRGSWWVERIVSRTRIREGKIVDISTRLLRHAGEREIQLLGGIVTFRALRGFA
jgi:hypothetical protein